MHMPISRQVPWTVAVMPGPMQPPDTVAVPMRKMPTVKMVQLPIHGPGAAKNRVPDTGIAQNTAVLARQDFYSVPRRHVMSLCGVLGHGGHRASRSRGDGPHEVPRLRVRM